MWTTQKINWKDSKIWVKRNRLRVTLILKFNDKVIITRDIETDQRNFEIKDKFNYFDFKVDKFVNNNSNIILLDNIERAKLYSIIKK